MNNFRNPAAFAFALAALVAVLHTAPASAMGHSGARTPITDSSTQTSGKTIQMDVETQAKIESLRKELAEIKEQLAQPKVAAITK